MTCFNGEIETLLADLGVPIAFLQYDGSATTYVTYMETDKGNSLGAEDEVIGYVSYYDFDVYSKGNYLEVIEDIHTALVNGGWTYQPSRDSSDMYEADTGYYHKTVCYCKETMI